MKKLIETAGNTGIILFILLNLANQFLGLEGPAYTVPLYLSILMLLPMADFGSFCACGPEPMLRALDGAVGDKPGQISLEERMGCGFGACMGCTKQTKNGPKRVCKDGPVFDREVLIW